VSSNYIPIKKLEVHLEGQILVCIGEALGASAMHDYNQGQYPNSQVEGGRPHFILMTL